MVAWRLLQARISSAGNHCRIGTFWHLHFFSTLQNRRQQLLARISTLNSNSTVEDYVELLQYCSRLGALNEGRQIHAQIHKLGLNKDLFVANHLVMMYGKCGSIDEARTVFWKIPRRNVFSWTILISVYAQHGHSQEALDLFYEMLRQHIRPHGATFTAALSACAAPEFLPAGRALHAEIRRHGLEFAVIVGTSLVSMYSKCGSLDESVNMFNSMKELNIVSWNAMIAAYAEHKRGTEALRILQRMLLEGIAPGSLTYVTLMSAYEQPSDLSLARYVHDSIVKAGFDQDIAVGTTLVNMYAKCGSLEDVNRAFNKLQSPNIVTWNVMIAAYVQHGFLREAVSIFRRMLLLGLELETITFINALAACCGPMTLSDGKMIHQCVMEHPKASIDEGIESVLLNMYGKCGSLEDAEEIFYKMSVHDLVAWNTMIAAYSQHGHPREALRLYEEMQEECTPDDYTYMSVLDACATLGALQEGKEIHRRLGERAVQENAIANSLVNMYGKCGIVDVAREIFDKAKKCSVTWNSMIGGYAQHGHEHEAFELFLLMLLDGAEPTSITFISVLSACANAGLPERAHEYFVSMQEDFNVRLTAGHYGCMAESLGKAGRLMDAELLIKDMPFVPDIFIWSSFLANCRSHSDTERGKLAAAAAIELDPDTSAPYVALSQIYTETGEHAEALKIRKLMLDRGIKKDPGRSMIKLGKEVYEFTVGDESNARSREIFDELRRLDAEMKKAGYDPHMKLVSHDVEEDEKEPLLFAHSERLAIAFGILSTPPGTTIRILKNLRVCGDCHAVTKLYSKITGREIVVRDSNRFHHFKDGVCSCKDYW